MITVAQDHRWRASTSTKAGLQNMARPAHDVWTITFYLYKHFPHFPSHELVQYSLEMTLTCDIVPIKFTFRVVIQFCIVLNLYWYPVVNKVVIIKSSSLIIVSYIWQHSKPKNKAVLWDNPIRRYRRNIPSSLISDTFSAITLKLLTLDHNMLF